MLIISVLLIPLCCGAQIEISGTVYDSSKLYVLPNVMVNSTSGNSTFTDSLGAYHIIVLNTGDSISFYYNNKHTLKYPVKTMNNYNAFDISLRVRTTEKYKLLKNVVVFSNNYRYDSIENRETYSKIFDREKPGISSTYEPGGPAGFDLDALIGIFQFRKNKSNIAFQKRLVNEEQDRYIDFRFSSKTVARITGLKGDTLELYRKTYRPDYFFTSKATLAQFYEYILNTSYKFKREEGIQ
ncbi:MAG: hypothetical protein ACMG51_07485 [Ginsengibacter sp.]